MPSCKAAIFRLDVPTFGSRGYVHIPKKDRKWKLDRRALAGFLVGFERGNSYRVYLPDNGKVVVSRDVIVDENWTPQENSDSFSRDTTEHSVEFDDPFRGATYLHGDSVADTSQTSVIDGEVEHHEESLTNAAVQENSNEDRLTYFPGFRRSTRRSNPPERFGFHSALFVQKARMQNEASSTPLTYKEAATCRESAEWVAAIDEEINQINKQHTWELVELPQGHRPVKCRWVYNAKLDSNNEITRYRARLVAKGFTQQKRINYDEIFYPVVKYSAIRFMLAMAADEGLEMLLLDV